jgi:hypothetical protein
VQESEQVLKSRIVKLPMAWDDKWTRGAIEKYMKSSRAEGPYLPSNIEFIAANNGLTPEYGFHDGAKTVHDTVFNASYMVMGLGDVYLGAPCAVPVDPRYGVQPPSKHAQCGLLFFLPAVPLDPTYGVQGTPKNMLLHLPAIQLVWPEPCCTNPLVAHTV